MNLLTTPYDDLIPLDQIVARRLAMAAGYDLGRRAPDPEAAFALLALLPDDPRAAAFREGMRDGYDSVLENRDTDEEDEA